MKKFITKHLKVILLLLSVVITILVGALLGIVLVYQKGFPQIEALEDIQPKVMTIIHDDSGARIKEFAVEKRSIIERTDIPDILIKAIIASEDNQFYSHWGINFRGTFRAIMGVLFRRNMGGGSSITQQLALNLFLTRDLTFKRKLQEMLLAIQIEKRYSKDQILTFYCNKIYLGGSVYGVEAASRYYFGKSVHDINLAEAALIPTIMPAPNGKYNVFKQPDNCLNKRNYVLQRMLEMNFITPAQYNDAIKQPLPKKPFEAEKEEIGDYFVEEVRKTIEEKYGDQRLYTGGLRVYTTLSSECQKWAEAALQTGLRNMDKRIGWRSKTPLFNLLDNRMDILKDTLPSWKYLNIAVDNILEGVVLSVTDKVTEVRIGNYRGLLLAENAKWTRKTMDKILKLGDLALFKIIEIPQPLQNYITLFGDKKNPPQLDYSNPNLLLKLALEQEPEIQGAVMVVDNKTGEIKAMVGGYSFEKSKWNNATQAIRQTGSTFKPIVYTAAIEHGYTPATLVDDEYFTYYDKWTGAKWEPQNHGGSKDYLGPLTLRRAFEKSRNVVTARIAEYIQPETIVQYAKKFGITADLKPYMSISLGAFEVRLSEMVSAYTVFPNLGVRVKPYLIRKVVDNNNTVLIENFPDRKTVLEKETAFIMNYMLQGVVKNGTAWKARVLKAPIGGKTGTTNDYTNAWFIGFSPSVTVGVWVGYDEPRSLGYEETGARSALPIFISFMEKYLEKHPETTTYKKPSGVIWVDIDKYTGKLLGPTCTHPYKEAFLLGTEPLEACTENDHKLIKNYYGEDKDDSELPAKPAETPPATTTETQPTPPATTTTPTTPEDPEKGKH